ncbi:unnamed protein product [Menidia menidia]|uniref:(Atlantic silverside) hypothetical protein n=1 Tax=Menidia menidia TaxID=238744 RepID=A0A8S4B3I7_9TELE|nr:unnamed protein product [Menidia menidia]
METARCACRRGQIAGTRRARPACVDGKGAGPKGAGPRGRGLKGRGLTGRGLRAAAKPETCSRLAAGSCEIVTLDRDSSEPRRTVARQTARCACRRGQIAGTRRARPACVDGKGAGPKGEGPKGEGHRGEGRKGCCQDLPVKCVNIHPSIS